MTTLHSNDTLCNTSFNWTIVYLHLPAKEVVMVRQCLHKPSTECCKSHISGLKYWWVLEANLVLRQKAKVSDSKSASTVKV